MATPQKKQPPRRAWERDHPGEQWQEHQCQMTDREYTDYERWERKWHRSLQRKARAGGAQTSSPSIKSAFEEVTRGWLLLAEQTEWTERRASSRHDEDTSN